MPASLPVSDAEAAVFEKSQTQDLKDEDGQSDGPLLRASGSAGVGGYNALFIDRGSEFMRVDGQKRTSLIIDPPDGKIPAVTPEARQRQAGLFPPTSITMTTLRCVPLPSDASSDSALLPVRLHDARLFLQQQLSDRSDSR